MASSLQCHKGFRNHTPSVLTCSLGVAPSVFTCEKKVSRERPWSKLSHETLEELPSLDNKELFRTVTKNPG